MERISGKDIDRLADSVNDSLRGVHIEVQGRNGHTALDLYRGSDCLELLHIGTKREVYTYLQGMRRLQLIQHPFRGRI